MAKEKDPFAEFEDWLVDGPAGKWPAPWDLARELTPEQQKIVKNNVALLLDKKAWKRRVDAFEAAMQALSEKGEQWKPSGHYRIRFDRFVFEDGEKDFSKLYFPCPVSFAAVRFGDGNISFADTDFGKGHIDFICSDFQKGDIDFIGAEFGGGSVDFSDARFGEGDVYFTVKEFGNGNVSFRGVKFGNGNVIFNGAKFRGGSVNFTGAKFGDGVVYLIDLKLAATAMSAPDMVVAGSLYVSGHFPLKADFQRLKVGDSASFSGCKFEQVPDFRDAKFDRPPDVANMEVSRPKLKKDRFWPFSTAEDPEDASRFRKLKAMALDASDHERDSYFFAREMLAKRGVETKSWPGLFINTLYDWLSIYGYSFLRPLGWLATSFTLFFIIYTHILEHSFNIDNMRAFPVEHSLRNFLPLIGGLFRYAPTPDKYTSPYEKLYAQLPDADITLLVTLGIVQSIIGGILLFLFLLALRNRFRLK